MWGVGNVSYGLTMRYLGISLGVGVAIGVTLVVGTLVPPMLHGQFAGRVYHHSGLWSMAGVLVALIGVAIVSYAGHQKEEQLGGEVKEFNVMLAWRWRYFAAFSHRDFICDRCGGADAEAALQRA